MFFLQAVAYYGGPEGPASPWRLFVYKKILFYFKIVLL